MSFQKPATAPKPIDLDLRPGQSIELLKELHILTRDGKLNQDSRRKLKQVYPLFQFIEKLLKELPASEHGLTLVDHGAGKSHRQNHPPPPHAGRKHRHGGRGGAW
jgi:hypothetical protein